MELHNSLNKLKQYYNNKNYLLDVEDIYKKIKEFSLLNNLKTNFSTCDETEHVTCDYLYVTNTECTDIKTASCDYVTFGTVTSYNVSTQIFSGYILYSDNLYLDKTKLYIRKNNSDILVTPTITTHSSILKRLNFSIPLNITDYFDVQYPLT